MGFLAGQSKQTCGEAERDPRRRGGLAVGRRGRHTAISAARLQLQAGGSPVRPGRWLAWLQPVGTGPCTSQLLPSAAPAVCTPCFLACRAAGGTASPFRAAPSCNCEAPAMQRARKATRRLRYGRTLLKFASSHCILATFTGPQQFSAASEAVASAQHRFLLEVCNSKPRTRASMAEELVLSLVAGQNRPYNVQVRRRERRAWGRRAAGPAVAVTVPVNTAHPHPFLSAGRGRHAGHQGREEGGRGEGAGIAGGQGQAGGCGAPASAQRAPGPLLASAPLLPRCPVP